jgi:cell division protein FtsQ
MKIYLGFVRELDSGGEKVSGKLSEVDVSNPEDVKALLADAGGADVLVHFGDEKFLERYRRYKAHLAEWRSQYPKLGSVDMRYERQVVLEMQPGAAVPSGVVAGGGGDTPQLNAAAATPKASAAPAKTAEAVAGPVTSPMAAKRAAAMPRAAKPVAPGRGVGLKAGAAVSAAAKNNGGPALAPVAEKGVAKSPAVPGAAAAPVPAKPVVHLTTAFPVDASGHPLKLPGAPAGTAGATSTPAGAGPR